MPFLWLGISILKKFPFSGKPGGHIDYAKFPNTGDWNIPRMIADVGNTSLRVYLYATRQTYDFDGGDILGGISAPALIIHGERDTIFPVKYGITMAGKIPGAKLVLFKDADHILALNKVPQILTEVRKFVLS